MKEALHAISGFSELLGDHSYAQDEATRSEMVHSIQNSSQGLANVVDNMIALDHYDSLHELPRTDQVCINELCLHLVAYYIKKTHAGVGLQYRSNLSDAAIINTNAEALKIMMHQLLDNAVKFTTEGTITLTADCDSATGEIILAVTDTGSGLQSLQQPQGFGLSICRRIIQLLKGTLTIDKSYTKGTRMVCRLLRTICLLLLLSLPIDAEEWLRPAPSDTLELRFRARETDVDIWYDGNEDRLDGFMQRLEQLHEQGRSGTVCIRVFTGASPEGPAELNYRLGERRGLSLRQLLAETLSEKGLTDFCPRIIVTNEGARWGELFQMVAMSKEPWREKVLHVLRHVPGADDDWQIDPREVALRTLDHGQVWQELCERYLPLLRSVGSAVITPLVVQEPAPSRRDTIVIRDTVYYVPVLEDNRAYALYPHLAIPGLGVPGVSLEEPQSPLTPPEPLYQSRCWALKSNMLLLATGTPNLQLERAIGGRGRWSLELEGFWSWWTIAKNAYANQLLYGSLELRLWLGNRRKHHTLEGWHIGLAAGGGYYDLEWRSRGYQGEVLNGYLNIGWQTRFGAKRRWLFDVGVGLGALTTRYRLYEGTSRYLDAPADHHLIWQRTDHFNWFGATHAHLTFGYILNKIRDKGDKR